jgi:hypothetical protein
LRNWDRLFDVNLHGGLFDGLRFLGLMLLDPADRFYLLGELCGLRSVAGERLGVVLEVKIA